MAQWVIQIVTKLDDLSLIAGTLRIKGETQLPPAVLLPNMCHVCYGMPTCMRASTHTHTHIHTIIQMRTEDLSDLFTEKLHVNVRNKLRFT